MANTPNSSIEKAIFDTLTNNATLQALGTSGVVTVYHRVAESTEQNPYVVFQSMTPGLDSYTMSTRAYIEAVYKIEAYARGNSNKKAQDMAEAIDAALTDQTIAVTGWGLMYLRREQIIELTDQTAGVLWNRCGGLFRVTVRPT